MKHFYQVMQRLLFLELLLPSLKLCFGGMSSFP